MALIDRTTRFFSEGVAVDEFGEWTGFYRHRPFGIGSPIEQNRKHIAVLNDVAKRRFQVVNQPEVWKISDHCPLVAVFDV